MIVIVIYSNNNGIHSSSSVGSELLVHLIWQTSSTREIPPFEKCCGFFKVLHIGLVEVGRLGQQLNVPTEGRTVAQTGDEKSFSLTALGLDPQLGVRLGSHCWKADVQPINLFTCPVGCPISNHVMISLRIAPKGVITWFEMGQRTTKLQRSIDQLSTLPY